jgi:hypothetical protein
MESLRALGVFDEYGPGAYQASEKLSNRQALIRAGRLCDAVYANELWEIAKSYKMFECDTAGSAMRAAMIKAKKQGALVNIYYPNETYIYSEIPDKGKTNVSTTGIHVGVLYNGRIHCNVYPKGLPEKEWLESFFINSDKRPRVEYLPF